MLPTVLPLNCAFLARSERERGVRMFYSGAKRWKPMVLCCWVAHSQEAGLSLGRDLMYSLFRSWNDILTTPPPLFLSVSSDFDCTEPLGMETGEIHSDQITASSQYNPSWSPERSRLNNPENGWTPAEDSNKEWIQVVHDSHAYTVDSSLLWMSNGGGICPWQRIDTAVIFWRIEKKSLQKKSLKLWNSPTLLWFLSLAEFNFSSNRQPCRCICHWLAAVYWRPTATSVEFCPLVNSHGMLKPKCTGLLPANRCL